MILREIMLSSYSYHLLCGAKRSVDDTEKLFERDTLIQSKSSILGWKWRRRLSGGAYQDHDRVERQVTSFINAPIAEEDQVVILLEAYLLVILLLL